MHLLVFQYLMMAPQEIWWAWQELFLWATEVMDVSLLSKKRFSNKLITLYIFLKISSIIKWSFFFFLLLFIMSTRLLFFYPMWSLWLTGLTAPFFSFLHHYLRTNAKPKLSHLVDVDRKQFFFNLAWISDFVIFFKCVFDVQRYIKCVSLNMFLIIEYGVC